MSIEKYFNAPGEPFVVPTAEAKDLFTVLSPAEEAAIKHPERTRRPERGGLGWERAEQIMGPEHFLGPETISELFKTKVENVPTLSLSEAELERMRELDQQLYLCIDRLADGRILNLATMNETLEGKAADGNKLLYSSQGKGLASDAWYRNENFINEPPRVGWRVATRNTVPGTTSKNYLQQTEFLAGYLQDTVFKGLLMPLAYEEAIKEFEAKKAQIAAILSSNWQKASEELSKLKITELTRETPIEVMYRLALSEKKTGVKSLENYTWTSKRSSGGNLVSVGRFGSAGAGVGGWKPVDSDGIMGVSFSRSA